MLADLIVDDLCVHHGVTKANSNNNILSCLPREGKIVPFFAPPGYFEYQVLRACTHRSHKPKKFAFRSLGNFRHDDVPAADHEQQDRKSVV